MQIIVFPLVVPTEQEVEAGWEKLDLSRSYLNSCYSLSEIDERSGWERSWFNVTLTVAGEHNLPPRKEWFYVVTRHGDCFKAYFAGKKTKTDSRGNKRNIWIFSFPAEDKWKGPLRLREKSVSNLIKIQTLP